MATIGKLAVELPGVVALGGFGFWLRAFCFDAFFMTLLRIEVGNLKTVAF